MELSVDGKTTLVVQGLSEARAPAAKLLREYCKAYRIADAALYAEILGYAAGTDGPVCLLAPVVTW